MLVYLFWLCLSKIKIDEYVVIFVSIKRYEPTVQETLVVMFSCSLLFLPIFFYQDNYPYFMMSTHFSFSFILCVILCWYLLCELFIIVPPLVHLSQPNHNQHHTTYVCRECIIRVLPPFPGGIQLLTNYMIAKKEQKQKEYVRYGI